MNLYTKTYLNIIKQQNKINQLKQLIKRKKLSNNIKNIIKNKLITQDIITNKFQNLLDILATLQKKNIQISDINFIKIKNILLNSELSESLNLIFKQLKFTQTNSLTNKFIQSLSINCLNNFINYRKKINEINIPLNQKISLLNNNNIFSIIFNDELYKNFNIFIQTVFNLLQVTIPPTGKGELLFLCLLPNCTVTTRCW